VIVAQPDDTIPQFRVAFISHFSIDCWPANESEYPQTDYVHQWNKHQQAPPAAMPGSFDYSPQGEDDYYEYENQHHQWVA